MKKIGIVIVISILILSCLTGCTSKADKALESLLDSYKGINYAQDIKSQYEEIEAFESKLKKAEKASEELEARKKEVLEQIKNELRYVDTAHEFRKALMEPKSGEAVIALMASVESEEQAKIYDKVFKASQVDLTSYMTDYFIFQHRKFIRDYTGIGANFDLDAINGTWLLSFDTYIGDQFDLYDDLSALKEILDPCAQNAIDTIKKEDDALHAEFLALGVESLYVNDNLTEGLSKFDYFSDLELSAAVYGPNVPRITAYTNTIQESTSSMYNEYRISFDLTDAALTAFTNDSYQTAEYIQKLIFRNGSEELDVTEWNQTEEMITTSYQFFGMHFETASHFSADTNQQIFDILLKPGTEIEMFRADGQSYIVPAKVLEHQQFQQYLQFMKKATEVVGSPAEE